jgi:large subunit ribosomal protein L17
MRHKLKGRHLSRTSSHREATRRAIVCALFSHGRIITTVPKAKEFAPFAEKLITLAKKVRWILLGELHSSAEAPLNSSQEEDIKKAFETLRLPLPKPFEIQKKENEWEVHDKYHKVRYLIKKEQGKLQVYQENSLSLRRRAFSLLHDKEIVKSLFEEIAPRYKERAGGYTRILKLSKKRVGDDAHQALLELVEHKETTPVLEDTGAPKS